MAVSSRVPNGSFPEKSISDGIYSQNMIGSEGKTSSQLKVPYTWGSSSICFRLASHSLHFPNANIPESVFHRTRLLSSLSRTKDCRRPFFGAAGNDVL